MIKKLLLILTISTALLYGCEKDNTEESTAVPTSIPFVAVEIAEPSYVFGVGSGRIFRTIPDTIAIAVDSIVGFEGGFGGKTKKDSIYILKKDMVGSWPDTTKAGGSSINFQKFNLGGFKASVPINIVLASPISNPGPTDFSGNYIRAATGITFTITKVFNGVYVIDNPGGGAVAPTPYLLYNYKDAANKDSLAFPIQPNPCGGGLKLVGASAPLGLTASEYDKSYPPTISSLSPISLSWKVLEFPEVSSSSTNPGAALCQWGTGVRIFDKK